MFRFTIRDVLWLTVVVAVALAWWADRRQSRFYSERAGKWLHSIREELWKEGRDLRISSDGKAQILNEKYSSEDHP
jgi:hypothetical protein